ncbi:MULTISPECIES: preprotein translocase subunit SecG [Atopobiaceae]|uniref:Protein-export membrane protein SecG n=1 Tax=Parafannyhessea umbonata TaxID=604330 RepID=A0A1H6IAZ6_9ACTN|nr:MULTISPECIES: preprotein translocase subunit SecG [Atopobiaceae]SEH44946.1 preprotein translocase subunit SecG [Parafannyhessea umbonata]SJZ61372.1 preprotein translocase subunit SecG [Olsenella sp. KH1P3]
MSPLNLIFLFILAVSAVLTIILILLHSGKGTGVSDMISSSMYNSTAGSGVWEKNLDRLTVITAVVFGLCILVMALTFPQGVIGMA